MTHELVVSDVRLFDGRAVDIGVSGGKISALAAAGSLSGIKRVSGDGGLCLRPLSDSHLHLDKSGTASAGVRPPGSLAEAISAMGAVKRGAKAHPDQICDRMVKTLLALRRNGTRFVRALVDVDETWGLMGFDAALVARDKIGDALKMQIVAFAQEGMTDRVAEMLTEAAGRGADAIGGHTDIEKDPTNHIKTAARIARGARLPLEVHVDEPARVDHFWLPAVLEHAGDIPDLTLVHCLSLGKQPEAEQDRWIGRIKEAGASVVIAPSVLLFGLPLAPIGKLLDAGIPVGIGSDNLQDVFVPMGTGRLLESVRTAMLVSQLNRAEWMAGLLRGATVVGFSLVANESADIESDSSATFSVFTGASPSAVLFGEDSIRLTVIEGKVEEEKFQ
jgi:cytosine deaminase